MPTTLVIGGGLSGLSLAYLLRARGEDVTLLEARERLGGNVHSREIDGFLLEDGPNGFLDKEPAMRALVDSLGLAGRLRPASSAANDRFLFRAGALRKLPASPPALLRSDALPLGARLRVFLEPFSRRGRTEDESLASFARRHIGKTATRLGIDAAQSGIFAGDPERLSAWAFPQMVELERAHRSLVLGAIRTRRAKKKAGESVAHAPLTTFDRGLSTLIDALGAALGGRARTGAPVQRVERAGGKWRAQLEGETLEADQLVLATPADDASQLLEGVDATLSSLLADIEYAPIAVAHVAFPDGASRQAPRGFGFLAPESEGCRLLGAIFISSVFPFRAPEGQHLVTCMIGGARHPERLSLDDGSLQAICADELGRAIGLSQPPRLLQVNRWPRAIPQYTVGHKARVGEIDKALSARPGLHLCGNYLRGVGLNDCVREASALVQRLST